MIKLYILEVYTIELQPYNKRETSGSSSQKKLGSTWLKTGSFYGKKNKLKFKDFPIFFSTYPDKFQFYQEL